MNTGLRQEQWEPLAQQGKLQEALLAYITERDHVTFTEIEQRFSSYFPMHGNQTLELGVKNVLAWAWMSDQFVNSIIALLDAGQVHLDTTVPLVYIADGGMLNLPLARRIAATGYKEPHWFPVCLRPGTRQPRKKAASRRNVS